MTIAFVATAFDTEGMLVAVLVPAGEDGVIADGVRHVALSTPIRAH
jgi:hypothetical protein